MNSVAEKLKESTNAALLVSDYSEVPYQDVFFSQSMLSPEEKTFVQSASVGDVLGPVKDNNIYRLYKLVDKKMAPDSVKLQMIIVPEGTDAVAANNRADSIISVIKTGKAFASVANELNPQSNGGEVGWVTEPMVAGAGEEFLNKTFNATKGEVLKINNRGGIQIVKVEDITSPVSKSKLALIQMTVSVSDQTLMNIDNELNKFVAENNDPSKFMEAAASKGYNVMTDMTLAPSSLGLPQVNSSKQVVYWAFNEKVGSIKKFDLPEQRVVAVLNSEITGEYAPLNEVSDLLKSEIIRDKKAEKLISELKALNKNTLDGYAYALEQQIDSVDFVKFSTPSISAVGREPVFNVAAKYAEVNKVQGPLKGNNGVYVLTVANRTEDTAEYNAERTKQMLDQTNMYRFNSSVIFNVLKNKMKVEDNRPYVFYRIER